MSTFRSLHLASLSLLTLAACAPAILAPPPPTPRVAPIASTPLPPRVASTSATPSAPEPIPPDARTARLVRLCALWGEARYLDPWVVEGKLDWDAALVAALPKALAAENDEQAADAAEVMLGALHDSVSRVERPATPSAEKHPTAPSRTVDGVLVARVGNEGWQGAMAALDRLEPEIEKAKLLVLDIRSFDDDGAYGVGMVVAFLASHIMVHEGVGISDRFVEHRGYKPQMGETSGDYETMLVAAMPTVFPPSTYPHPSRVVFVTNESTGIPEPALAMQRAGDAAIVSVGHLGTNEYAGEGGVRLSGGYMAHLRHSELIGASPRADIELDAKTDDDKAIAAALRAAHAKGVAKPAAKETTMERAAPWRPDATYEDEPYPSRERRILSLFRFWSVIHYFYPYLPLMGRAWDDALVEFLPRFEKAANAREYALAVAELAAKIPDGHVGVRGGKEISSIVGDARAPFQTRMIEGEAVVTSLYGDASLPAAGIDVGDVILAVDGEDLEARMARTAKYVAAATDSWRSFRTLRSALTGPVGSTMKLTIRTKTGDTRDVSVPRSKNWSNAERTGPVYRVLEDGIGYVDLDRLENGDVDAMFTALEKTRAIVFDMRGYPHSTGSTIASRLNTRYAAVAAQFFEPFVTLGAPNLTYFRAALPTTDKPLYTGKTVMLVDERTVSQAEHTGLNFEAANGTTFIGSQTAGSNGDVTNLSLPGGLFVTFTGVDIRHADGSQLQRIGLVPEIEVHPTIEGIRTGRDEVLERALSFLKTGK